MKYFAYDRYNGEYAFFKTEQEAREAAERYLGYYAEYAASDGWPEDLSNSIGYGRIIATTVEKIITDKKDFTDEEWEEEGYSSDWDKIVDYSLVE